MLQSVDGAFYGHRALGLTYKDGREPESIIIEEIHSATLPTAREQVGSRKGGLGKSEHRTLRGTQRQASDCHLARCAACYRIYWNLWK